MHLESRKATSKSALAARARTLNAKNLAWLEGFPVAVEDGCVRWISVPPQSPAEEIRIEGRHLSRATYTLNKLRTELAPGLPRLAGDPDAWLASIERRIELLKGAVHHGRPLPPADSLPQVLSWVHAGDPDRARTVLDLAEDWSAGFGVLVERLGERPALLLMLRLLQLAAGHKKRVEALASCLFDERAWDVSLVLGPRICHQIRQGIASKPKAPLPEELPAGRLGADLADWCEELVQQSRRTRQQALRLFEMAAPIHFLASWSVWWDELRLLQREARELVSYGVGSRRGLRARLEAQSDSSPSPLTVEDLFEALRRMTVEPAPGRLPALLRVLALSPAEGRTRMFIYWSSVGYKPDVAEARVLVLLAGFERYLRRRPVPDAVLVGPWITTASDRDHLEEEILDREPPRRAILEAYDYLATVAAQHGKLDMGAASRATALFFQAGEPALAARLFDSLVQGKRTEHYDSPRSTSLALRLCRERPERFADVLKALGEQEENAELPPSDWPEAILGPLSSGELGDFVRESIVTGQLARLVACGTKSVLVEAAGELPQPTLGQPTEPDWLRRYPQELHPAICRLAAVLDDAEIQVTRWLGSDFPDTGKLQREIEAIESRLEQVDEARRPALLKRLANLKERIGQPAAPGPGRLERLRARLDRAWGRAILDRWERELDARLPAALGRLLKIELDEVPPCLAAPRTLGLLAAATRLPERRRAIAFRVFAARCGPAPWDLRDAPQNRAFVESLPRLDWSPWIDGVGTVTLPTAPRLHLALEDDPLEVFRMGAHFQTCLSPGAMNFYSVFTNAADINKRVLYARDACDGAGKVVGRCLLAITATGGLIRFDAYCHDGSLGFDQICTDFATDLARRMGTELVSFGRVPTLVASDWYDDGARDLGDRFPALEEGSPFRKRLATLHPGELPGELRRALKPARLDESTLPLVLGLSELGERPELIVPLLRRVAECPTLPDHSLVTAASLGVEAGSADLVRRLLLEQVIDYLRPACFLDVWVDQRAVDVAVRLDPARLLDLLRRTRPRSVRHWLEEVEGNRLEFAAQALEALHRPAQAQALWRRLAFSKEVEAGRDQRDRARAALAHSSSAKPFFANSPFSR
jgi:hypothetical protein